jgi:hypothetical protein
MSNFEQPGADFVVDSSRQDEEHLADVAEAIVDKTTPTISVDRTLAHFVDHFDVDIDSLRDFYYGLPHENKMDLSELRIHFSAARPVDQENNKKSRGRFLGMGLAGATKDIRKSVPEIEETTEPTIVVFLGSEIMNTSEGEHSLLDFDSMGDIVNGWINEVINHELVHFAQLDQEDLIETESVAERAKTGIGILALEGVVRLYDGRRDVVVGLGAAGLTEATTNGGSGSLIVGAGVASLSHWQNRHQRRKQISDREFERYIDSEPETDARQYEKASNDIIKIDFAENAEFPEGYSANNLVKPKGSRILRAAANDMHRDLATTPRGMDPKDIRRAVMMAELRSLRILKRKQHPH